MMIYLASNSPRRRHLIALGGWRFSLLAVDIDESSLPAEAPDEYVIRLAENKARAACAKAEMGAIVIAADTTVADGGDILGKPDDEVQAEAMLRVLRGRNHRVYTAQAILRAADGKMFTDLCVTDVPMREYSDDEMMTYIASGDPLDKAGAYAIQHPGFKPVENLQGCYANVVGLPLCHLTRTLKEMGYLPDVDIPQACQSSLEFRCSVYAPVLRGEDL
jgi:MAF protein